MMTPRMRPFLVLVVLLLVFGCEDSERSSSLPPCKTTDAYWTNCIGVKYFSSTGQHYVGEWKDNKFHGRGTESYDRPPFAGMVYTGEFKYGARHGQGTLRFGSEEYQGEFKNGLADGGGTMTFEDGRVQSGRWQSGQFLSP